MLGERCEYCWNDPCDCTIDSVALAAAMLRHNGIIADDLFAGAGGWDLAAEGLGIHARGVENMPEARATRDADGLTTIHDDVWSFEPDWEADGLIASLDYAVGAPRPTHSRYHSRNPSKLDEGVKKWVSMAEGLGWGLVSRPSFTVCGVSSNAVGDSEWGGASVRKALREAAASNDPDVWREYGWGLTARPAPTITGGGTETGGAEPIAKLARYTSRPDWLDRRTQSGNVRISVEEAAILQSFPKDWPLSGGEKDVLSKKYLQIGNAVPPGLAAPVLRAALGVPF